MNFINCHRTLFLIKFRTVFHPGSIFPFITGNICNSGCCSRTKLRFIAIWIGFVNFLTVITDNIKLIKITDFCLRYKSLIDSDRSCLLHRVLLNIPFIKFTHYRNRSGIRCPHCKIDTFFASPHRRMRSELFINVVMGSLSEQILIQLCKLQLLSHSNVPPLIVNLLLSDSSSALCT